MNVNVVNTAGKCRAFAKGLALAPALRFPIRKLRRKHKKQSLSRKICERNWNVQINLKREKKKVGKENSRPFRRKDSRLGILHVFLSLTLPKRFYASKTLRLIGLCGCWWLVWDKFGSDSLKACHQTLTIFVHT